MYKEVLQKWLKCRYIETKRLFLADLGNLQGSPISLTIRNMVLDGLEEVNNLENLRKDIEEIRHKISIKVLMRGKDKSNQEILKLSMKLDGLIMMYIKNIQER